MPIRRMPIVMGVVLRVVGAAEIGELLGGLSRQRVSQLTSTSDFPKPLQRLRMGSVWRYEDVQEWAQRTGRSITPISAR